MNSTSEVLKERGEHYGDFAELAHIVQTMKSHVRNANNRKTPDFVLTSTHKEALEMILLKIGRIITGDPDHVDSWRDIAGYAELVIKEIERDKHHIRHKHRNILGSVEQEAARHD